MAESILDSTKKTLGLDPTYTVFDNEVILHINSVLGTLTQLGIGPEAGFAITDASETWEDFLGGTFDPRYNPVKSYMFLRVKLLFDPPAVGFVITALEKQKEELEWRINAMREDIDHPYVAPVPVVTDPII